MPNNNWQDEVRHSREIVDSERGEAGRVCELLSGNDKLMRLVFEAIACGFSCGLIKPGEDISRTASLFLTLLFVLNREGLLNVELGTPVDPEAIKRFLEETFAQKSKKD